ncbi:MAG TPA: TadE family protein [Vicinamibacterales bacterium]|jgi:Flp pilus assembly protein TadG|nr:TadE family protein [Vicinamibacterales bacterium]
MHKRLIKNQRGAALLETAITLPLILLVSVAIFEFGRAYQTWQVLTNAAREGARVAIINGTTPEAIKDAVKTYAEVGGLTVTDDQITLDQFKPLGEWTGSEITVTYPFDFMVLNPVAKMVADDSKLGESLAMTAVAVMRNEG